jgi:hypothetical protein
MASHFSTLHSLRFVLSNRQRLRVERMTRILKEEIAIAGVKIRKIPLSNAGGYERKERTILLAAKHGRSPIPTPLDRLFTLAHEFGHHQSCDVHDELGRKLQFSADDCLFEESRAWEFAKITLNRLGMRGYALWDAFHFVCGNALMQNAEDFQKAWWLLDKLRREKVACPCGKGSLGVFGTDSHRKVFVACCACTRTAGPFRSMREAANAIRGRRMTGLKKHRAVKLEKAA